MENFTAMREKVGRVYRTHQASVLASMLRDYCDERGLYPSATGIKFQFCWQCHFNPDILPVYVPTYFHELMVAFLGHYGVIPRTHRRPKATVTSIP